MMPGAKLIGLLSIVVLALAFPAKAAEAPPDLDRMKADVRDEASLQSGARTFVNYCLNCHSASMMRYNRFQDLGLTEEQIKDNLLFTGDKVGDLMNVPMSRNDAKNWFGAAPPDLTVIARTRGTDWLYKAALAHLTRSWALELAAAGVGVNAVAAGPTETEFLIERMGLSSAQAEAIKADERGRIPLGRRGTPEEIAQWIVLLASPAAAWITGQVVAVDGGLSIA